MKLSEGETHEDRSQLRLQELAEYARKDGSEIVISVSDHAQDALGDIVFVEMAEVGKVFAQGNSAIGVVRVR